jgi:hypothetical protein
MFKLGAVILAFLSVILFINFWVTLRPQWVSFDGGDYQWGTMTVNASVNATIQLALSLIACFILYGLGQLVQVILFIEHEFIEIKARRERRQSAPPPTNTPTPLVPGMTPTDTQEREATALLYERARQYRTPPPAAPDMSAYRPKRRWTPNIDQS